MHNEGQGGSMSQTYGYIIVLGIGQVFKKIKNLKFY